jgi:hypothetical protein
MVDVEGNIETLLRGSTAFGIFQQSATQAFSAIVTGSMSATQALRQFAAQGILAEASVMFATSISEGVKALVSLAIFDGRGAGAHGLASAKALGAAVALGAIARALGVGGSLPGAGAATGGFHGGSAAGGGQQVVHRTYFIGDSFTGDSPRKNAARMKRTLRNDPDPSGEPVTFS